MESEAKENDGPHRCHESTRNRLVPQGSPDLASSDSLGLPHISEGTQQRDFPAVHHQMRHEANRLESLRTWPKRGCISIHSASSAGLYYCGHRDELRCAFCGGGLKNWDKDDDPFVAHYDYFGYKCAFIKGYSTDNIPADNSVTGHSFAYGSLACEEQNPIFEEYSSEEARSETFEHWQYEHIQKSHLLAEAGFISRGNGDSVICYFCGVLIRQWEAWDDPWEQHAIWSPSCSFLSRVKGHQFVMVANKPKYRLHCDEDEKTRQVNWKTNTADISTDIVKEANLKDKLPNVVIS